MTRYAMHRFGEALILILVLASPAYSVNLVEGVYYSLQPSAALPAEPTSLLVQAPSSLFVESGATLSVYLMRADELVAASRLSFDKPYSLAPLEFVPFAVFLPQGQSGGAGGPLPGTTLTSGNADLKAVAAAPDKYQLLWILSAGSSMGAPQRAIMTGPPMGFAELNLKLSAVSAAQQEEEQRLGSVLFFNRFTSNASNPNVQDTKLSLTNTNPTASVYVRLFLVDKDACQASRVDICLAAQQTRSFLVSEIEPNITGYVVAIATDAAGQPIKFNWLMGQAIVKQSSVGVRYAATLSAMTVGKRAEGAVPNVSGVAEMVFNDEMYDRLPMQIAFDNVQSQASGNATTLTFYRPLADLASNAANAASVQITGWGNNANPASLFAPLSLSCYGITAVGALRPKATIDALIPAGNTAWLAASATDQLPLLGAQFNAGSFSGGANARPLKFSVEYRIRVPVAPVTCQ
jgi:hypothetical protein